MTDLFPTRQSGRFRPFPPPFLRFPLPRHLLPVCPHQPSILFCKALRKRFEKREAGRPSTARTRNGRRASYVFIMAEKAFELNGDGSAKDPAAFRTALKADPERVKALQVRSGL